MIAPGPIAANWRAGEAAERLVRLLVAWWMLPESPSTAASEDKSGPTLPLPEPPLDRFLVRSLSHLRQAEQGFRLERIQATSPAETTRHELEGPCALRANERQPLTLPSGSGNGQAVSACRAQWEEFGSTRTSSTTLYCCQPHQTASTLRARIAYSQVTALSCPAVDLRVRSREAAPPIFRHFWEDFGRTSPPGPC